VKFGIANRILTAHRGLHHAALIWKG